MRILLIAYDFPPTRSPRALRWRYLARELVWLGHEVHVLVPDLGDPDVEFPHGPGRIIVHRVFPGPYRWFIGLSRQSGRAGGTRTTPPPSSGNAVRLNWRGRIAEAVKQTAALVLFPDIRAEWNPWARRALARLLPALRPDVVITSHEPASTLPLGAFAWRRGFPWVADLGDPVCAPYTPRRWRRRALALEALVCARASLVLVTTAATRELLVERHHQDPARCVVLSNGYDDRRLGSNDAEAGPGFDSRYLELLYAGRLYGYRDPLPLLQAVAKTPGVRLTLVIPDPPTAEAAASVAAAGERVRVVGPLPHAVVMTMLERADVLVDVGYRGLPAQIAAKLYEYLGIRRPILHTCTGETDAAAPFLRGMRRGWVCEDDADKLAALLGELRTRKQDSLLDQGLQLAPEPDYAHSALGRRLSDVLEQVVAERIASSTGGDMRRFP